MMDRRLRSGFLSGLVLTAPIAVLLVIASTVVAFIVRWQDARAVLVGAASGVVVWLLVVYAVRPFMTVSTANTSVYRELRNRARTLTSDYVNADVATNEHLIALTRELGLPDPSLLKQRRHQQLVNELNRPIAASAEDVRRTAI